KLRLAPSGTARPLENSHPAWSLQKRVSNFMSNSHNGHLSHALSDGSQIVPTEPGFEAAGGEPLRVGKADLHIHTSLGDGLASVEQIFDFVENHTDLDVIAITDHDDVRGAMQALDLVERRRYRFKV